MRRVLAFLAMLAGGSTAALAFDFTPETFGDAVARASGPSRSSLLGESHDCPREGIYRCRYSTGAGQPVAVFGGPGSRASRVVLQVNDGDVFNGFTELQRLIYGLCSPNAGDERRAASNNALVAAFERDEAPFPHVHAVLDGVRYSLVRLMDRSGTIFMAEDHGTWATAAYPERSPLTSDDYPPR